MHKNKKHPLTITLTLLFTILLLCICIAVISPKTQTPPMESFAKYLEELCREGHRSQLDQCVISRRLSLEEAAALADSSPLLEHMAGYAEHMPNINTAGKIQGGAAPIYRKVRGHFTEILGMGVYRRL